MIERKYKELTAVTVAKSPSRGSDTYSLSSVSGKASAAVKETHSDMASSFGSQTISAFKGKAPRAAVPAVDHLAVVDCLDSDSGSVDSDSDFCLDPGYHRFEDLGKLAEQS